jgi:hypothetical protein
VSIVVSDIGDPKRFCARFDYDSALRLSREKSAECASRNFLLQQDLPVRCANTNLRFPSA